MPMCFPWERDFLKNEEAFEAVKLWLETEFSKEERHIRRIEEIN